QVDHGESEGDEGKKVSKAKMLAAFLKDPNLGDTFMTMCQQLQYSEKVDCEEEWVSRKQLLDVYSESEAEEMINEQKII
ncbi:unnamed protein product, partial [Prorocentrum cordatum]